MANMVEITGLTKQYHLGEVVVEALRGVDLAIRQGEFVAVMGPSGSGKSTLLHLCGGLDTPTAGEIVLAGTHLSRLSEDELTLVRRRQIGFVFQFFNLLPILTVAENVALPLVMDGRPLDEYAARLEALLALVGLSDRQEHRPDQLSGGEQQRVAIARALVTAPALLLADEPTGNLDSAAGLDILRLLRRACDEQGQTILLVTHDPRTASLADRVVFLKDGRIMREARLARGVTALPTVLEVMTALGW